MSRIWIGTAIAVVAGLLAVGCSSPATPERAYYLLRGGNSTAGLPPASGEQRAGIRTVEVAPYLDRAGIVVGLGPNEVREAVFHLWAEPLRSGIRAHLEDRVSEQLGYVIGGSQAIARTWRKRVDIAIRQLHGLASGEVRLAGSFTVTSGGGDVLAVEQVNATTRQSEPGYASLVAAEIQLLDELGDQIADSLR